jgi:hypothetical protein
LGESGLVADIIETTLMTQLGSGVCIAAAENDTRVAIGAGEARAVADQAARGDELAEWVDRGNPVTRRQPDDLFSSIDFLRVVLLFCAVAEAFNPRAGRQFPPCNPGRPKS